MSDWGSEIQFIETIGIWLEQVRDSLVVFDETVCGEMAAAFANTEDPYAHHIEDRYYFLRSVLNLSIARVEQIAEECNSYSGQLLEAQRETRQT